MKVLLRYIVGTFPLIAVISAFLGNPYFSVLLIALSCFIAIPVSYFAIRSLANGANKIWAIVSLICSSTAALFGLIGITVAIVG